VSGLFARLRPFGLDFFFSQIFFAFFDLFTFFPFYIILELIATM